MSAAAGREVPVSLLVRLVPVELRRMRSRAVTWFVLAALVLLGALSVYASYDGAKPPSAAVVEQSRQAFDQAEQDFQQNGAQMQAQCQQDQDAARASDPTADFGCDDLRPRLESYLPQQSSFAQASTEIGQGAGYLGMFLAFVLGATFLGAEISSGSMGTWLTFEPRRLTVLASKLLTAGIGGLVLGVVATAVVVGGSWVVFAGFGTAALPGPESGRLWGLIARALALSGLAGLAAGALATLLKHTAAALGVLVGYLVVAELLLGQLLRSVQPWLVQLNVQAFLAGQARYTTDVCSSSVDGGFECRSVEHLIGMPRAGLFLAALTVVLLVGTAAAFRRRDVA